MKKIIIFLLILPFSCYSQILKKDIVDKMLVLTFDDATASQYSVVAPLLKQYGFGATFFICEFQPIFSDSTKYMNWRQIGDLNEMGFEVANHTRIILMLANYQKTIFWKNSITLKINWIH